jgi:hypothetical protein
VGAIDFEPNFDFIVVDGTPYDGYDTKIDGVSSKPKQLRLTTDSSVAWWLASCPELQLASDSLTATGESWNHRWRGAGDQREGDYFRPAPAVTSALTCAAGFIACWYW